MMCYDVTTKNDIESMENDIGSIKVQYEKIHTWIHTYTTQNCNALLSTALHNTEYIHRCIHTYIHT